MSNQIPVWEIDIQLGSRTFTFLTTEPQSTYDGWEDVPPVGYLVMLEEPTNA